MRPTKRVLVITTVAVVAVVAIGLMAIGTSTSTAADSDQDEWWNETGDERLVVPGEKVTITRQIGAPQMFESELRDDIKPSDEPEGDLNITIVEDNGAYETEVDRENLTIVAKWNQTVENPSLVYELTLPENTTGRTAVEIHRERTVDDVIFTGEADELTVIDPDRCANERVHVIMFRPGQFSLKNYLDGWMDGRLIHGIFSAYQEERPAAEELNRRCRASPRSGF